MINLKNYKSKKANIDEPEKFIDKNKIASRLFR